jgi:WD40 repeat protein
MQWREWLRVDVQREHETLWCATWSPNGQLIATCGTDKAVRIWDARTGLLLGGLGGDTFARSVRRIDWSPCGLQLALACFDSKVRVYRLVEGVSGGTGLSLEREPANAVLAAYLRLELVATLEGHESEVKAAVFNASGTLLATCARDKTVWIWECGPGAFSDLDFECVAVLAGHTQDVKSLVWHPRTELIASASYDNTIRLWCEDVYDGEWYCCAVLSGHESTVWSVAFAPTADAGYEHLLASAGADGRLLLWQRCEDGTRPETIRHDALVEGTVSVRTPTQPHSEKGVGAGTPQPTDEGVMAEAPSSARRESGSWSLDLSSTRDALASAPIEKDPEEHARFAEATQVDSSTPRNLDPPLVSSVMSGKQRWLVIKQVRVNAGDAGFADEEDESVYCVDWSHDGRLLATACADGHIRVYEATELRILMDIPAAHSGAEVNYVQFQKRRDACGDWSIHLGKRFQDMSTETLQRSYLLASTGDDGRLRVWVLFT